MQEIKNSKYEILIMDIIQTLQKMQRNTLYKFTTWILGIFTFIFVKVFEIATIGKDSLKISKMDIKEKIKQSDEMEVILAETKEELKKKYKFFNRVVKEEEFEKEVKKEVDIKLEELTLQKIKTIEETTGKHGDFYDTFQKLLNNKVFFIISFILSFPMYILIGIYKMPYIKYIFERLIMMVFVLLGVTIVVFTIIYVSPTDPAAGVLGAEASPEQIENFREAYGLNDPYIKQLWKTFKKIITFNLGGSYVGNQNIAEAIARRFPITFKVGLFSLILALFIAIPAGVMSAIKQYSTFDYVFMFLALLGLSIPNFWLGLILILNFAIKLKWLPATYQIGNWISVIMPVFVVGTGMSATLARMTRSSMLEVSKEDYVMMARAKGLAENKVITRHMLKNALLPIITIVGMQFAAVLGGAATTEKVFNIKGMCEYIASRTLLPDTPVVIAGVIYIAIAISISNLIVDILYTFVDPRIKTRLKNY